MALSHADRVVPRPRRVYKTVAVQTEEGGGFAVGLDGRVARTPAQNRLVLPTEALAQLAAAEWDAQATELDFAAMPATRLAFTVIDRAAATRAALAEEAARYAGSDLLAYFAEEPAALVAEQEARWTPELAWAAAELGVDLHRTAGVVHRPQPEASVARVRELAAGMDDFRLSGLVFATALFGSVVLALGVERGRLSGEAAHDLARLDEAHQERAWGVDEEAAKRTAARLGDARFVDAWFRALEG